MDVLQEWGCTWMWEGMRLTGDDSWLEEAIRDNSLVAVTDSSYMRDKFPTITSCAIILECTKWRGRLTGGFLGKQCGVLIPRGTDWTAGNSSDTAQCQQSCTRIEWVSAYLLGLLGSAQKSQEPTSLSHTIKMQTLVCAQKHHGTLQ